MGVFNKDFIRSIVAIPNNEGSREVKCIKCGISQESMELVLSEKAWKAGEPAKYHLCNRCGNPNTWITHEMSRINSAKE